MKRILCVISIIVLSVSCGTQKSIEAPIDENATEGKLALPTEAPPEQAVKVSNIEWLDFETAIERNEENPKHIFIDIYTDWCGWCKKMDVSTFIAPEVVAYMNAHFYAVKMDAEMREAIAYNERLYEYKRYNAKTSYNELAVSLLGGQMSFPSFVVLDKKEVKRGRITGYKTASVLITELKRYVK